MAPQPKCEMLGTKQFAVLEHAIIYIDRYFGELFL